MKRTIIESPYAGDIEANVLYARQCVRDSVLRGEAPIASHLLFTQEGILRDDVPAERALGIKAGLTWAPVAEQIAFYTDRGWGPGMLGALDKLMRRKPQGLGVALRSLEGRAKFPLDVPQSWLAFLITCIENSRAQ